MNIYSLLADSRQDEVFKSISENVSESDGMSSRTVLAIVLVVVAVILLIALFNSRGKRAASVKSLNHSGKLTKELAKQIGLRPVELRQLKLLAQGERDAGKPVENPLVFLLCPTAFMLAARSKRVKVDRKAMTALARKMGLVNEIPRR